MQLLNSHKKKSYGTEKDNTYQFNDYSRYDFNLFSEEEKRKYRDEHYETDLRNAYELGKDWLGNVLLQHEFKILKTGI